MKNLFENWRRFTKEGNENLKESETVDALKDLIDAEEQEDERISDIEKKQQEEEEEQEEMLKKQKEMSRNMTQDNL